MFAFGFHDPGGIPRRIRQTPHYSIVGRSGGLVTPETIQWRKVPGDGGSVRWRVRGSIRGGAEFNPSEAKCQRNSG